MRINQVENKRFFTFLESEVDSGEASVIALAFEKIDAILILDDLKARNLAKKLQLDFTGTLGLILKAKQLGIIPLISPIMHKIQQTNFRFSDSERLKDFLADVHRFIRRFTQKKISENQRVFNQRLSARD